jgi:hypothetical protein
MPLNKKRISCVSYREHGLVVEVLNAARDIRRDCLDNDGVSIAARTSRVAGATPDLVQPMPKLYIHPRNAASYDASHVKVRGRGAGRRPGAGAGSLRASRLGSPRCRSLPSTPPATDPATRWHAAARALCRLGNLAAVCVALAHLRPPTLRAS